jgi:hypothetical protein
MTTSVFTIPVQTVLGVRIVEDERAHDLIEDWSRVRSPSRAARRLRQGHRQNIRIAARPAAYTIDGGRTVIMHPTLAAELRRQVAARIDATAKSVMADAISGRRWP